MSEHSSASSHWSVSNNPSGAGGANESSYRKQLSEKKSNKQARVNRASGYLSITGSRGIAGSLVKSGRQQNKQHTNTDYCIGSRHLRGYTHALCYPASY
jgi:hypothetical protein